MRVIVLYRDGKKEDLGENNSIVDYFYRMIRVYTGNQRSVKVIPFESLTFFRTEGIAKEGQIITKPDGKGVGDIMG